MHLEMRILTQLFNIDESPSGPRLFQFFSLFRTTIRSGFPYRSQARDEILTGETGTQRLS